MQLLRPGCTMRNLYTILVVFIFSQISFGQVDSLGIPGQIDTLGSGIQGIQSGLNDRIDSISNPIKNKLKSNAWADTISSVNHQLDSIQNEITATVDSLTGSYTKELTKLQSSAAKYQSKIDSLTSLNLPTDKYKARLDSVTRKFANIQQDLKRKLEGLQKKATEKIKSIKYPPELEDKVSTLTKSIGNLEVNTIEAKLPANLDIARLNGMKNSINLDGFGNVPQLNTPDLPKLDGLNKELSIPNPSTVLNDINGAEKLNEISGEAEALTDQVNKTTKDLNPNSIDKLAESKASELKEVTALKEASNELPINGAMSEKEMKEKLKEQAQKVAVDHFAGKQEQLKAAMEKISKYKQKHSNVKSIADVAERPRNEMKDKPFIERIIPGIGIRIQKKGDDLLVDFNPYVGYRFTTRITAGVGWNERVPYNIELNRYNPDARIFGPRVFGEFKLGKGFSPRLELEVMNTVVPSLSLTTPIDPTNREWVFGAFVGLKKEYKLFKRVKGTASVMTRLFDPDDKSPYADVLNVRFGFEFPLKRKKSAMNGSQK